MHLPCYSTGRIRSSDCPAYVLNIGNIEKTLLLLDRLDDEFLRPPSFPSRYWQLWIVQSRYSFYSFHLDNVILLLLAWLTAGWFQFCFTTGLMTFGQTINGGFPRLPSILHTVEQIVATRRRHGLYALFLCRDKKNKVRIIIIISI